MPSGRLQLRIEFPRERTAGFHIGSYRDSYWDNDRSPTSFSRQPLRLRSLSQLYRRSRRSSPGTNRFRYTASTSQPPT
jgi:hypothetical protein